MRVLGTSFYGGARILYLCLSSWVTAKNQIFYVVDLGGRVIYFGVGLSELVRVGDFNRGVVEQFGAI